MQDVSGLGGPIGVLSALPEELGGWAGRGELLTSRGGIEVRRSIEEGREVLSCVGGVGKVRAARAAEALINSGASRGLLIVGTCGSLSSSIQPGVLVHCREAVEADMSPGLSGGAHPDACLLEHWLQAAPGQVAGFLTADRPVMSPWKRWMANRRSSGPCVADMETAAAGAVAGAWGVPWAALRAVTDSSGWGAHKAFRKRYPVEAGRAADTVKGLLVRLRV